MTRTERPAFDRLVVVGASAGGVTALAQLVSGLAADQPFAVLVVLHVSPTSHSVLPAILERSGPLPAAHPRDREPIVAGHIYVAPPGHHLLVGEEVLRVTSGPREHGYRPSVDATFRSAALRYGQGVVGVVLTGGLSDGAAGLATIAHYGGVAIVQDLGEAEMPDMPAHALELTPNAKPLRITEISDVINDLTANASWTK